MTKNAFRQPNKSKSSPDGGRAEAAQLSREKQAQTQKLRELRLAKEAEERAAENDKLS
jgi:hypothetical protein